MASPKAQHRQRLWLEEQNCRGSFKLKEERFKWDIRKKFVTQKVLGPWHSLSRDSETAPSLEVFEDRLNRAWNNLG